MPINWLAVVIKLTITTITTTIAQNLTAHGILKWLTSEDEIEDERKIYTIEYETLGLTFATYPSHLLKTCELTSMKMKKKCFLDEKLIANNQPKKN